MGRPELGADFDALIPENGLPPVLIEVIDKTTRGFTPEQLKNMVWCLRYQALFHYNRSPWVERGYSAPVADLRLVTAPSSGSWLVELLDTSTEPGALGWHEDVSFPSKVGPSGVHSARGRAAGTELPKSVVFVKTSRADGVEPSEVAGHEVNEMMADPWVMDEAQIRVYANPADGKEYIGETGDPVQGRGYDVGAPEGRPCGVPEAVVADFAYPAWWGQPQKREATSAAEEFGLSPRVEPFQLAPEGYMSVRTPGGSWEQIFGADKKAAEAKARAFEKPGESG